MPTSTPDGGLICPKRMLKPWAKNSASPSERLGSIDSSYTAFCSVSGSRIMMRAASDVAWPGRPPPKLGHPHRPGARQLSDPIPSHQVLEVVELRGRPRQHGSDGVVAHIDDAALEHLHELDHLTAIFGLGPHRRCGLRR